MTYSDEEIIGHIQRLADGSEPPTAHEFDSDREAPTHRTARHHFGSWGEAVKAAGFEPRGVGHPKVGAEEVVEHIQRLANDGEPPTVQEFNSDREAPSHATAAERFGSWAEAVEAAGYQPLPGGRPVTADEEIIEHIQRLADGGEPPTAPEFDSDPQAPCRSTVRNHFGRWSKALKAAGYEPRAGGRPVTADGGQP